MNCTRNDFTAIEENFNGHKVSNIENKECQMNEVFCISEKKPLLIDFSYRLIFFYCRDVRTLRTRSYGI